MKRTKIHNVVFQMLVVMIVTGSLQLLLKNGSAAKGGNAMGTKKISLEDITGGDDSETGVLKVKYFDDEGADKIFENNNNNRILNTINSQHISYNSQSAEYSKPQLFLLYQSLKVDC
jgi:hypothetical protein